ncbi:G2/mitotic-specific cyclin [Globomyces sp. JEL0801]|nr:G2/mitotic-specific cyclin [Globomyces sp. JEL0801]
MTTNQPSLIPLTSRIRHLKHSIDQDVHDCNPTIPISKRLKLRNITNSIQPSQLNTDVLLAAKTTIKERNVKDKRLKSTTQKLLNSSKNNQYQHHYNDQENTTLVMSSFSRSIDSRFSKSTDGTMIEDTMDLDLTDNSMMQKPGLQRSQRLSKSKSAIVNNSNYQRKSNTDKMVVLDAKYQNTTILRSQRVSAVLNPNKEPLQIKKSHSTTTSTLQKPTRPPLSVSQSTNHIQSTTYSQPLLEHKKLLDHNTQKSRTVIKPTPKPSLRTSKSEEFNKSINVNLEKLKKSLTKSKSEPAIRETIKNGTKPNPIEQLKRSLTHSTSSIVSSGTTLYQSSPQRTLLEKSASKKIGTKNVKKQKQPLADRTNSFVDDPMDIDELNGKPKIWENFLVPYQDPIAADEYQDEIYTYWKELEMITLPNASYATYQPELDWTMRKTLISWIVEVHSQFKLLPETLYLTVNLIDRTLSAKTISVSKLQLIGIAALLISSKYEEILSPSVMDLVYMSANTFHQEEILRAERHMLMIIKYQVIKGGISRKNRQDIMEPVKLFPGNHFIAPYLYTVPFNTKHSLASGYTEPQLLQCVYTLLDVLKRKERTVVYEKYTHDRFEQVSIKMEQFLKSKNMI